MIQVLFVYQGVEFVGVVVGEVCNFKKMVLSVIWIIFWGIMVMFVVIIFLFGMIVLFNDLIFKDQVVNGLINVKVLFFVVVVDFVGVFVLLYIINVVLLMVVLLVVNFNVYLGSCVFFVFVEEGFVFKILIKINKYGILIYVVVVILVIGLFGFLNLLFVGGQEVFNWLFNISGVVGFIIWGSICVLLIGFRCVFKV